MKLFSLHRYVSVDMETLLTLQEIAKQTKRLADAWETTGNGNSVIETPDNDTTKDGKKWTRAEVTRLRHLFVHGTSADEMVKELGRTKMAIYSKLNQMGYKRPPVRKDGWTQEEDGKLLLAVQLHGQTWEEIAKLFEGRSAEAVRSRFRKLSKKTETDI